MSIGTISCTTTSSRSIHFSVENIYKTAQNKLFRHNYSGAIQDLRGLQNLYLFEPCSQQIHLDLIYAYYKSNDLNSANDSIQGFLKLYPNNKYLDYVLYMHGIINMSLDANNISPITKYLNIHWYNHDPSYAHSAFYSFLKLIQNYPNSQYSIDAYKRLIVLKNRIAEHELSIIKFYHKRKAYISVIIRTEKMLRYFPDTQATRKALYYMKQAYQSIYLLDQSDKIEKIIIENPIIY